VKIKSNGIDIGDIDLKMGDMIVELNETLIDSQTLPNSKCNRSLNDSQRGTLSSGNSNHNNPSLTLSHKF
jgi:hypothetical protein